MSKKELPCPHCGQDIHIPARYNAENIAVLEADVKRLETEIEGWEASFSLMEDLGNAYKDLCTAYRVGSQKMADKALSALEAAKEALAGGEGGS